MAPRVPSAAGQYARHFLFVCTCAALSCSGRTTTTSLTGPSAQKCSVTAALSTSAFSYVGGEGTVQVDTARECSWNTRSDAAWIHLSAANGAGEARLTFKVDGNAETSARQGAIVVESSRLAIAQDAAPPPPPPPPPPAAPTPSPTPPPTPTPTPSPAPAPTPLPPSPPDEGHEIELEGSVSDLAGSCPALRFALRADIVVTNGSTQFKKVRCGDVRNGLKVEVRGRRQVDGTVLASRVERD